MGLAAPPAQQTPLGRGIEAFGQHRQQIAAGFERSGFDGLQPGLEVDVRLAPQLLQPGPAGWITAGGEIGGSGLNGCQGDHPGGAIEGVRGTWTCPGAY